MNQMCSRHHSTRALSTIALLLAAMAGCTKSDPPQFRLDIQADMMNLKLKPDEQATALLFTSGEANRLEDLKAQIAKLDEEIAGLSDTSDAANLEKLQARRQELDKEAAPLQTRKTRSDGLKTVENVLTAAFGTPDEPYVFEESGLDLKKVRLASGSPSQQQPGQRGLYRLQCAHCHGITGDGAGPTAAFLNPYPRDYRQGVFKFKSTQFAAKPTRADLMRTLVEGINGTAMPSFALLPQEELESLVEYVKYLSIRGQVESEMSYRLLIADDPFDMTRAVVADEFIKPVADTWAAAEEAIIIPGDAPEPNDIPPPESVALGNELFHGERAACVKCHGPTALGDSEDVYYDNWNKDKEPGDLFWLLPKQQLKPRNLRTGIYRGGRRPMDLYRRIYAGIPGTPMPGLGSGPGAAPPAAPAAGAPAGDQKLTDAEIWHLVNYVRSLPYDEATRGPRRAAATVAQGSPH